MRDLHAAAVRTPSWVRAAPGIRVILASLMAVLTVISAALSAALPSATSTTSTYEGVPYVYDGPRHLSSSDTAPEAARGSPSRPEAASWESPASVRDRGVAANTAGADIAGARFAQSSYSEMFSSGGRFAGQSIDDVAGSLRSGALSPKDVPIDVIVRDGNSLILNTRSSQALIRAGFPRSSWNVIDRTGQAAYEARLSGQLGRNGLTSYGTDLP